MNKKILGLFSTVSLLTLIIFQPVCAEVILYEKIADTIVSNGVVQQNIKQFTNSGWQNINVLRVNLKDSYINVDSIFSKEGISTRSTVLKMANDSGAIAAINGDFFSPKPGTNLAHSIGPVVKNGQLISTSADNENKDIFSVFSLNKNNRPSYLYWNKNISITAPNGQTKPIADINKFGWYSQLSMYDRNWGTKTVGKSDNFPTLTEMIVVKNKVQGFSIAKGSVDIPINGYVISGDYEAGEFLKNNFKIGDTVIINTKTIPNWNTMKMAIGGGAILVKNGQIPVFSHDISGLAPRTALGTTKDNLELILVTVDGRQLLGRGMTQQELASLIIELGAYNAINFDGGGSTTMVSRPLGYNNLEIVNSYSDSSPRSVTDGIGVFSTAPKGVLSGIKIETQDTNIFMNSSRTFTVVGYDDYHNPANVNLSTVKWSFSGVSGKFVNNTFYPSSSGYGKVIAEINGIKTEIGINVLDSPVELEIYPNMFSISSNPQWLGIEGIDKQGYRAFLSSNDLTFDNSSIVSITDNYIRSKNGKSGVIKTSFSNVYAYFSVYSPNKVLDTFEQDTDDFWGYPSTVKGSYSLSNTFVKEGSYSGNLEFDFSECAGTKAAYIKFGQNGYSIDTKPTKLKVWVYAPQKYSHSIKAEVADANDKIYRANFSSSVDWTGWRELETTLPDDLVYPIKLRKLYIVETGSDIKNKGELYFDKLEALYNESGSISLPPSKKVRDYQEALSRLKGGQNSFRLSIFGDLKNPTTTLENTMLNKITRTANLNKGYSLFIGDISKESLAGMKIPYTISGNFSTTQFKNSNIITLSSNGSSNSIRVKNASQWTSLFNTLKSNTKDNIFILLDAPINGDYGFSDKYEAQLFKETLSNYVKENNKNVWVIYSSNKTESMNENGVKYIGVPKSSSKSYLTITVNNNELTYKFRKIL